VTAEDIWRIFRQAYALDEIRVSQLEQRRAGEGRVRVAVDAAVKGKRCSVQGEGNGPVDAFVEGFSRQIGRPVKVLDYHEHSIGAGAEAKAAAYVEVRVGDEPPAFGVAIDANIVAASLQAVLSGVERVLARGAAREQASPMPA
jgi:2-isopropylmalate synthase